MIPQLQSKDVWAVLPVLNEEKAIPGTLRRLRDCGFRVVAADGGSTDGTVEAAASADRVVRCPGPGRARQMNLGAAEVPGGILFFVHADSRPPLDAADHIARSLARPGVAAGAFRLRIDSPHPILRVVSALANLRSRLFGLPYGDQGLFLYKETFDRVGGFREMPLMEDVDIVRRLGQIGRIALAPADMFTSDRRWRQSSVLGNSFRNLVRLWKYFRGVPPEILVRDYRDVR